MSLLDETRHNRGFTLIELLVVIAIIGILSSVVLASLNSARSSSRDARRQTDLQQMSLALELFYDSCGEYPNHGGNNQLDTGDTTGSCSDTFGDYMDSVPSDPQDGSAYGYNVNSDNSTYCLGAELENTDPGDSGHPDNHVAACESGGSSDASLTQTNLDYAISP